MMACRNYSMPRKCNSCGELITGLNHNGGKNECRFCCKIRMRNYALKIGKPELAKHHREWMEGKSRKTKCDFLCLSCKLPDCTLPEKYDEMDWENDEFFEKNI